LLGLYGAACFSVIVFVPTALAAHCFLFLEEFIFLMVKSKNQRAAPTAQNKNIRHKKQSEATSHKFGFTQCRATQVH